MFSFACEVKFKLHDSAKLDYEDNRQKPEIKELKHHRLLLFTNHFTAMFVCSPFRSKDKNMYVKIRKLSIFADIRYLMVALN